MHTLPLGQANVFPGASPFYTPMPGRAQDDVSEPEEGGQHDRTDGWSIHIQPTPGHPVAGDSLMDHCALNAGVQRFTTNLERFQVEKI